MIKIPGYILKKKLIDDFNSSVYKAYSKQLKKKVILKIFKGFC